jgi:hypothetical protein
MTRTIQRVEMAKLQAEWEKLISGFASFTANGRRTEAPVFAPWTIACLKRWEQPATYMLSGCLRRW